MNATCAQFSKWLEATAAPYLASQRWFGDKGRPIAAVHVADLAPLPAQAGAIALLQVEFAAEAGEAEPASYQMPILVESGAGPAPDGLLARVQSGGEALELLEGLAPAAMRQKLLELMAEAATLPAEKGEVQFLPLPSAEATRARLGEISRGTSAITGAEQSNSSAIYRDEEGEPRLVLKLFRRLHVGINPELEITAALTAQGRFHAVPRTWGQVRYGREGADEITLAVLEEFVRSRGDAWSFVLETLREQLDSASAPEAVLRAEMRLLGRRTAELHLALADLPGPAFAPEPICSADQAAWQQALGASAEAAGRELAAMAARLPAALSARAAQLAGRLENARQFPAPAALGKLLKMRVHGDYHLGQVLKTADDFCLLDFEGEPARPIAERRKKNCVLKDVAGMLRSFNYAAATVASERPQMRARLEAWERSARDAFWSEYRQTIAAGAGERVFIPADDEAAGAVLAFFEMEKAVYELRYEMHHRPDWIGVPLGALEQRLATL